MVLRAAFHFSSIFGLAFIANVVQIGSLLMLPFSRRTVSDINCKIVESMWRFMMYIQTWRCNAIYELSGSHSLIPICLRPVLRAFESAESRTALFPEPESAIVISNHLCDIDWTMINALAKRRNMLAHCKYFIKRSLMLVPFFGLGMKLAGFPVLERSWSSDKDRIASIFEHIKSTKLPCWLVTFLEGTRMTPQKMQESAAFCRERNLPVFENVMYPRRKGFQLTLEALRGTHVTHIYDLTLAYMHLPTQQVNVVFPTLTEMHGDANLALTWRFHLHVDRIAITELPNDDAGVALWLEKRWALKDRRLAAWRAEWPRSDENSTLQQQ